MNGTTRRSLHRLTFRLSVAAALAAAGLTVAAACGGDGAAHNAATPSVTLPGASAPHSPAPLRSGTITVFAASSLTDAFSEIGAAFKNAHPGIEVHYNFAGSPTLCTQLEQGAAADVLAVADQENMQAALDKGVVLDPGRTFARNKLVIIAPRSNPGGVSAPRDLAKSNLKLILALPGVPVGKYAREAIVRIGADPASGAAFADNALANVVSEEPNVKAVVTKIQLGESDAGIVYATDVTVGVAPDVTVIPIPDAYNVIASYPIAVTTRASRTDLAQSFIEFVLADGGQTILRKYGFLPPP